MATKKTQGKKTAVKRAAAKKTARGKAPRMVMFTDVQLLRAGMQPPFPDTQGTYEDPDVEIPGGQVPANLPKTVPSCPGRLVIYSSDCILVANCNGFKGPGAGNNKLVKQAEATGRAVARKIKCPEDCSIREISVIWKGWDCGNNPLSAVAAVELEVHCFNPEDEDDDDDVQP